jgi:putative tributyrin esterase
MSMMFRLWQRRALLLVMLALVAGPLFGQATAPKPLAPNVEEHRLDSKLMGRPMAYRVVLPGGYADTKRAAERYAAIYLLHGLTGRFSNWTDNTKVAEYALNHRFIIVTPEGANGWYTDSATTPNDKFESYVIKELIPAIDAKYRTLPDRTNRMVAGLSMGGYGAVKYGLKYPELFSLVGSFSGALGAPSYSIPAGTGAGGFAGVVATSLAAAFGPAGSDARKANDVFSLVRGAAADKIPSMPFFYVSCGTEDLVFSDSREFSSLLVEKKMPHEYRQHPGGHDWIFWNEHIREFMAVAEKRLKK